MATFTATLFLGDLCGVHKKILAWPSPPPLLLFLAPLFCVGNQNDHCPREKSIYFRFVRLKELDRRSEVQMLLACARSGGGGGESDLAADSRVRCWKDRREGKGVAGGLRLGR